MLRVSLLILMLGIGVGCRSAPRGSSAAEPACPPGDAGLQPRAYFADLKAVVAPPLGWTVGKREDATAEGHRVWVSPTGKTAYGVIHFSLPLPVGYEPVLWVFIREMRRSEGEAILISRQWDSNHNLLRFVARGGLYTVRTSLFVRGFSGWAVYAGTLTRDPVVPEELTLAERARELTLVGRAATPSRGK